MENYYQTALLISTFGLFVLCGYYLFFKKKVPNELLLMFSLNAVLTAIPWIMN